MDDFLARKYARDGEILLPRKLMRIDIDDWDKMIGQLYNS
jgi:hypothetical protein